MQYQKALRRDGLDPETFGPSLFENYGSEDPYLFTHSTIYSNKTLAQALMTAGVIAEEADVPKAVTAIYQKSVPKLKTQ